MTVIKEITDNHVLRNIVVFHAKQAVEKALKANIEEFENEFIKIHPLEYLLKKAKPQISFEVDLTTIKRLDKAKLRPGIPPIWDSCPVENQ